MRLFKRAMLIPLVVVHDLDIDGADARPDETDSPLVIDTNTVLTLSIPSQGLEAIAWWHFQIIQTGCNLELPQLPPGDRLDVHEALDPESLRE